MSDLMVKLMVIAALTQFGISDSELRHWHAKGCMEMLEERSRDVLKIGWKAVSIFSS